MGQRLFFVRGFRDKKIREMKVVLLVKMESKYLAVSGNFGESGMKCLKRQKVRQLFTAINRIKVCH